MGNIHKVLLSATLIFVSQLTHAISLSSYFPTPANASWVYNCDNNHAAPALTYSAVASAPRDGPIVIEQIDPICAGSTRYSLIQGAAGLGFVSSSQRGVTITHSPAVLFLPTFGAPHNSYPSNGTFSTENNLSGTYFAQVDIGGIEPVSTAAGYFSQALRVTQSITYAFTINGMVARQTIVDQRWLVKDLGEVKLLETNDGGGDLLRIGLDLAYASLQDPSAKDDGPCECGAQAGDPIHLGSGNSLQLASDYALPSSPLRFQRIYNSRTSVATRFGFNWRHEFDHRLTLIDSTPRRVHLQRADGKVLTFHETPGNLSSSLGWQADDPDNNGHLSGVVASAENGLFPTAWRYVDPRNNIEDYDSIGRLKTLVASSGAKLSFSYTTRFTNSAPPRVDLVLGSIADDFGRKLTLNYDASLHLMSIADGTGMAVASYSYDSVGRLAGVTYLDGKSQRYRYNESEHIAPGTSLPQALTSLVDENNTVYATWDFDDQGRAVMSQLAGGVNRVDIAFIAPGNTAVTDVLGKNRSVNYTKVNGVTKISSMSETGDHAIPGSDAQRSHDIRGNTISRSDFRGNTTCYKFEPSRNLPTDRVEGLSSASLCAGALAPSASLPATARRISRQWHPNWRLETRRAEPGRLSTSVYQGQPDPFAGNAPAACAPANALLPNGKPIAVLCRLVQQATTDSDGHLGFGAPLALNTTRIERQWTYNRQGQVLTETAPNGGVTLSTYDSAGNTHTVTNALGHSIVLAYDSDGRLTQQTSPSGLVTTYGYDPRGRLLSISRGGQVTNYIYTPSGQIASVALPIGYNLRYTYDAAQRLTGWSDNRGASGSSTLDRAGNIILAQVRDASSTLVWQLARSINQLNQATDQTMGANQVTQWDYNLDGDPVAQTNGLGQTTRYALDSLNRIVAINNEANATAQLSYNADDAISKARDFKNVATVYQRDSLGNATGIISPDAGERSISYNSMGLPQTIVDALGQATQIEHDLLGRPTRVIYADGQTVTLRYDLSGSAYNGPGAPNASRGTLSEITDRSGTTSYQRDIFGRVLEKVQTLGNGSRVSLSYSYNAGGQLTSESGVNGETVQYVHDSTGQLSQLSWNGQPLITNIVWNPLMQPIRWQWALGGDNPVNASRSYDSAERLTQTEFSSYTYDAGGRISSVVQQLWQPADDNLSNQTLRLAPTTWNASYDATGRIVGFVGSTTRSSYTYDANGNRLSSNSTVGGTTTARSYSVDSNSNRQLGFSQIKSSATGSATSSVSYQYNTNGDLIHDGLRNYSYDASGRLSGVTTGAGDAAPTTRYATNALGQRVFKSEPIYPPASNGSSGVFDALATFFKSMWGPSQNAAEALGYTYVYDEAGSLVGEYGNGGANSAGSGRYVYLPTANGPQPVAYISGTNKYAVHSDHLNTPRRLTNADGLATWQWAYSAFGDEPPTTAARRFTNASTVPTTGTTFVPDVVFNLRYPGQYADVESGLFYNYFRSYRVGDGRYTQSDPIGLAGGWNTYGYVEGNPLMFTDPEGLIRRPGNPLDLIPMEGGGGSGVGGGGGGGRSPFGSKFVSAPQCPPGYDRLVKDPPFNPHGQKVFSNGKDYITQDVDQHNGGAWKGFDRRGNRTGTYDANMKRIGK